MALSRLELERVLAELAPMLHGGWIQKIHQPTLGTLIFDVRTPGRTHRLLISARPDTSRLHLTSQHFPNPTTPPAFCQFLRAHFQGAKIDAMSQVPYERIVEIAFIGKDGMQTLVCELTGKKTNILVLNAERHVLRDLTHQRDRIGHPYTAPPHRQQVPHAAQPIRFTGSCGIEAPVSAEIDAYYQDKESILSLDHAKEARRQILKRTIKKERRRIAAWQEDMGKASIYRSYARYGELIKANLSTIAKGAERITVVDYFDETLPEVTIPLDAAKSPQGNMDDYFRKHRKYLTAARELTPRIAQAEWTLHRLQEELSMIEQGNWTPPPAAATALRTTAQTARLKRTPSSNAQGHGLFRRFVSTDGLPIFVGRNARENDALTFGLAKSDDLWLHARGTPGSHVVVRLGKGAEPPLETLRDAATLALVYSDLKKSGKGEVVYTRRKWVKKAKGQTSGAVTITQEKSLHVSLDKTRLDALKLRVTGQ
ncbi:MAG: fibronectin-binding domain-containing protein [Nitrospira sp.]|nr:fibronectin-binding domain-containing protein [Nitrospira sp.]